MCMMHGIIMANVSDIFSRLFVLDETIQVGGVPFTISQLLSKQVMLLFV